MRNVKFLKKAIEERPEKFEKVLEEFNYCISNDDGEMFVPIEAASKILSLLAQSIMTEIEEDKEPYGHLIYELEYKPEEDWCYTHEVEIDKKFDEVCIKIQT